LSSSTCRGGDIYPGASFDITTHTWTTNDLALLHLHVSPGGAAPLPLAPVPSVLGPNSPGIALGYGCAPSTLGLLLGCPTSSQELMSTSAGAFGIVLGGQNGCPSWALCFEQAAKQRLDPGDDGGPWTVTVDGGTVGVAVTSTSTKGSTTAGDHDVGDGLAFSSHLDPQRHGRVDPSPRRLLDR
jgi:hypothetical protein